VLCIYSTKVLFTLPTNGGKSGRMCNIHGVYIPDIAIAYQMTGKESADMSYALIQTSKTIRNPCRVYISMTTLNYKLVLMSLW